MINPFKSLSDLKAMREKAVEIQRALASEVITVEQNGVKVVITGDQKVQELAVDGNSEDRVKEAVNEAIAKSQEVAAKKLQEISGGLGGLLGK